MVTDYLYNLFRMPNSFFGRKQSGDIAACKKKRKKLDNDVFDSDTTNTDINIIVNGSTITRTC